MNPQQEYRECVMAVGRGGDTVITSGYRKSLDSRLQKLGLFSRDAAIIEDEVLSLFRQYEKELLEQGLKEYPIQENIKPRFKGLRQTLGLTDDDIASVEGNVFTYLNQKREVISSCDEGATAYMATTVGAPLIGWAVGSLLFPPAAAVGAVVGLFAFTGAFNTASAKSTIKVSYEDYMLTKYGDNWKGR